jgi:hypothetical protein
MEKSTSKFARYFKRILQEDMSAGDAGVGSGKGGFSPTNINSSDSYAPGDARVPKSIGKKVATRKGSVGNINKKDRKKKGIDKLFLKGENAEEEMCPDACCGMPVSKCKCGPDCPHCDCHKINNA